MSITLYGLKNCDSCRKALKYIESGNREVTLNDVRDLPPTNKQLNEWCKIFGRDAFVNKRSTTWRTLTEEQKNLSSDAKAVALIKEYPTLMKRPVIVSGKNTLLGFKAADVDALIQ